MLFFIFGASLVIPPYGVYRGAASFWSEPQWKEKYDVRSEQLAVAIEYATSTSQADRSQSIEENHQLRDWVKQLPQDERAKLKEMSQNYGAAIVGCSRTFAASMLTDHINLHPCQSSAVQHRVASFQSNPGFSSAWKKVVETVDADAKNFTAKQQESVKQASEGAQERIDAGMKNMEAKINATISELFN